MKVYFCGWIYKEHWTNDELEGGDGVGVVMMTKQLVVTFEDDD